MADFLAVLLFALLVIFHLFILYFYYLFLPFYTSKVVSFIKKIPDNQFGQSIWRDWKHAENCRRIAVTSCEAQGIE